MKHRKVSLALFALSLFPAFAVSYDFGKLPSKLQEEALSAVITADVLSNWVPPFIKYLLAPFVLIYLLFIFGSEFESGRAALMLSKSLTKRRYFMGWITQGVELALIPALGMVLSGSLAMLYYGLDPEDYILGAIGLSVALIGVVGVALLIIPAVRSGDTGVFLGIGAFITLLLASNLDLGISLDFLPFNYLQNALSFTRTGIDTSPGQSSPSCPSPCSPL
ncbi:ABC-type transport system, Hypothetical permease component, N-terminus [Thermococcus onnurineus NA1]|uniref:ABC-type transport system, Hypothetical permease component, N-terminus n=1 Tax=Thermococcus onnurineus (strain NA1) TaxID=523850 RepID=B6YTU7_THEON|nr:hypothetical protein [Thermococcus onnurineus]ACJ17038.1 ABC-type transport system, Hypothetical permease component, N-terminus [Thermococcus onnurineus NA1]